MAVMANKLKNSLIIEYENGVDDEEKAIITRQKFSKMKLDATDDALYAVAQAMQSVLVGPITFVTKQVESAFYEA